MEKEKSARIIRAISRLNDAYAHGEKAVEVPDGATPDQVAAIAKEREGFVESLKDAKKEIDALLKPAK